MAYRASKKTVRLKAVNWDLTGLPVEIGFGPSVGSTYAVVKTTEATPATLSLVSVTAVDGKTVSTLECTLTSTDTAYWTGERVYTIRIKETPESDWEAVAQGSIKFEDTLIRP